MVIRTMPSWQFRWSDSGFDRWWSYGFGWGCDQATLWERRKEEGNGLAEMLIDQFQYIKIQTLQQGLGTLDASGFFVHGFRSWLSLKKWPEDLSACEKLLIPREKKLVVSRVILQGIKQKKCVIHCWASRWFLLIYSPQESLGAKSECWLVKPSLFPDSSPAHRPPGRTRERNLGTRFVTWEITWVWQIKQDMSLKHCIN